MVVNWPVILSISGLIAEIVGALLMANGYLGVMRWYQVPWILLKCLWRKDTVAGAKAIKNLADEDNSMGTTRISFNRTWVLVATYGYTHEPSVL